MNFVEELVAEWLEYKGWLVTRNVRYGEKPKGSAGGYKGECDILAFHPGHGKYKHVECSQASLSRAKLAAKFLVQFNKAKDCYAILMPGSSKVQRLAVGGWTKEPAVIGEGIEIKTIPQFVADLCQKLEPPVPWTKILPQKFPLLRAIQCAVAYGPGAS